MSTDGIDFLLMDPEPKKIFTPNASPGINDEIKFRFINNTVFNPSGEIYDLSGMFIADMYPKTDQGNYLMWDGKYKDGGFVRKGVYVYQIKCGSVIKQGTIIVAR
jgi:hypothetical protein